MNPNYRAMLRVHWIKVAEEDYDRAVIEDNLGCPRDMYIAASVKHQEQSYQEFKRSEQMKALKATPRRTMCNPCDDYH